MNRTALVAAVTAAAMLLAACQPSDTEQTPGPTVSPILQTTSSTPSRSTPSVSSSPPPTADAALLAEATKALEVGFDLESSLGHSGGLPVGVPLPDEFKRVMMGRALDLELSLMRNTWEEKVKHKSGQAKQYGVRAVSLERDGSLIALNSCRDGRGVTFERAGEQFKGVLIQHTSYYKRDSDGRVKMFTWVSEEVDSCA
ncbi:hypothetical protein ACQCX5_08140 [Propionibacteriaceae bacterium G57]|uniref:hypothetical protein n=1 Tax=Aestuariimicrobium sp. G57 TaxID=3418485 RepID=UPI003DA73EA9